MQFAGPACATRPATEVFKEVLLTAGGAYDTAKISYATAPEGGDDGGDSRHHSNGMLFSSLLTWPQLKPDAVLLPTDLALCPDAR